MFHGFIQQAHDMVALNGPGLHIDVHGYTKHNADNWTEIGYNIPNKELDAGIFDIQVTLRLSAFFLMFLA